VISIIFPQDPHNVLSMLTFGGVESPRFPSEVRSNPSGSGHDMRICYRTATTASVHGVLTPALDAMYSDSLCSTDSRTSG
jgi:hypothetical protein